MNKLFFSGLMSGTLLFSQFKIIRTLSTNNYGGVYLCEDTKHNNRLSVLKILSMRASEGTDVRHGFWREVRVAQSISHPNVVKCRDFYADDEFTAIEMEFVKQGTLADLMVSSTDLNISLVISILTQISAGISAIHKASIVHRDLKPENILVDEDGTIKVADFGLASGVSFGSGGSAMNQLVGTMNYLSPEYIQHGKFDERSDVYALGIIGYELLTGRLPFQGSSLLDSLIARVKFDPKPPSTLRKECPAELERILLKAINRSPEQRYASGKEFHDAILSLNSIPSGVFERPELPPSTDRNSSLPDDGIVLN